jgi:hypothetical protein
MFVTAHAALRWRERFGRDDLAAAARQAVVVGAVHRDGVPSVVLHHPGEDAVILCRRDGGRLVVVTVYEFDPGACPADVRARVGWRVGAGR